MYLILELIYWRVFFLSKIRVHVNQTLLRQSICFSLLPRSKIYLSFSAFLACQREIISKPSQAELSSFPPKGKINKTDPSYSFSWLRHKQTSLNFPTPRKSIVRAENERERICADESVVESSQKNRERKREKEERQIGLALQFPF